MTEPAPTIGSRMASGAVWMVALRSTSNFIGFFSTLVLARLLVPEDFGIVALAIAIFGSLSAFSEFSLDLALIQNQSAKQKHYNTVWTLSLLRGCLLSALLVLAAKPAAVLFEDDRLIFLMCAIAFVPLLEGFVNVGVVEFRKQLTFREEFKLNISSRLGGVLMTIPLAFLWRDYWALVVGQIFAAAVRLVLSYTLHSYRPRLALTAWRDIFHFSKWLFINSIITMVSVRAPTFLIGAFLNSTSIGIFTLSKEMTNLVSQSFIAPVQRTFFPGFSKISHDKKALQALFLRTYGVITLVSLPLIIGVAMTAELFIPLLLGENWLATVPILEILVFDSMAHALQGAARPFFLAVNKPAIVAILTTISTALLIPALIFGIWSAGLLGAAWAIVIIRMIILPVRFYLLHRFFQIAISGLISRVWRTLLSCILLVLTVWTLKQELTLAVTPGILEQVLNLALVVVAGAVAYITSLLVFWILYRCPQESPEAIILKFCRSKLSRIKRGHPPSLHD